MVRPGSGRFGVGFWVGFWVGLRARDFPTERVLSRTPAPLIIRTVGHQKVEKGSNMVFIQDIVRGTELTIASGGPPGGLPAATADPRQPPSPAARLAQARNKIGSPFWPAAHSASLLQSNPEFRVDFGTGLDLTD